MKLQFYILLILLFGFTSCENVSSLVESIANENRIECRTTGFAGNPSSLYKTFEKLKNKASKEELLDLMNHDSLAVVGYASYALIDKELIEPHDLLIRFIDREDAVSTFCGCLAGSESISSLIYHRYWNSRIEYPSVEKYEEHIVRDSKDLQKIDSLILYARKPDWILLSRAFENRIYEEEFNPRIAEWAFQEKDLYALKYILRNLRAENEEKLLTSLNKSLVDPEVEEWEKKEIKQMLKEIQEY